MPNGQQEGLQRSWWRRQIDGFQAKRRHEQAAVGLYGAIVAAARAPEFFGPMAVPDTMNGRFEMITLHAALVMRRLRAGGAEGELVAQALFDLLFADMDRNLREAGVGDLSVGRHVKGLAATFLARAQALEAPLESRDRAAIALVVAKNLETARESAEAVDGGAIADRLLAIDALLATQPAGEVVAGRVRLTDGGESR